MAVADSDEFDDDETEEVSTPHAAPAAPRKQRRNVGVASTPARRHESQWQNKEADLMWCEILERMKSDGRTPYEILIAVRDMSGAEPSNRLTSFEGASVQGSDNQSPGELLVRQVEDIHMTCGAQGNGRYQLDFCWKVGGQKYGSGVLNIKAPAVIMAMRQMKMREQAGEQQYPSQPQVPPSPPQGMGRPPPQWQGPFYPPPQYPGYPPAPPYGYGYPYGQPPQQPAQNAPEVSELEKLRFDLAREREVNARNQGMLEEILRAQREGRAPNIPPAAPAAVGVAAPQAAVDVATVVRETLATMLPVLGIGRPSQQSQANAEDQFTKMLKDGMSVIVSKTMQQVMGGMQRSITGMGAPLLEEESPAEIVPDKPEDMLPFVPSTLEQTWADGRKVGVAVNKETGKIDWTGTAFANPFIAEKVVEVFSKAGDAFADAMKKVNAGGPHIVRRIPDGAQPAGVPASVPPPPPPPGSFGSGWET